MPEPPPRRHSQTRLHPGAEGKAPPSEEIVSVSATARRATPIGMPAPPAPPPEPEDRQSYDDIEQIKEMERLERERAQLLAKAQDLQQENERLREMMPVQVFPPPISVPPPDSVPSIEPGDDSAVDIKAIERAVVGSRLGRTAISIGVLVALAWNAFNSVRATVPMQKAEAVQARLAQNEQLSGKELQAQAIERYQRAQRDRATYCWFRQVRGALARQGIELPSLPPGGMTVLRLGDDDPNKPGPPHFMAQEKCTDYPPLPPEMPGP